MFDSLDDFYNSVKGKKIGVIGVGVSNTPLIEMLVNHGAEVCAYDSKTKEQLGSVYNKFSDMGVKFSLGEDYLNNLQGDIIFKTPGIRYDNEFILRAKQSGSVITSEMEVFFDVCKCKKIAITGSDGKTTTSTVTHKILTESGLTCHLGGNIGMPLLPYVENIKDTDIAVLELSSFQLHTMRKSPDVAVITNISPNHLDMHKSYEEYIDAKANIYKYQTSNDTLVINMDNSVTSQFIGSGKTVGFSKSKIDSGAYIDNGYICYAENGQSEKVLKISDILVPGSHNVENYMAAICATRGLYKKEALVKTAKEFGGVEHRIELVREKDGVKYYNSSIDSSPNRTINTLNVFGQKVILISGGKDKGIPYDDIGKIIVHKVKTLILIGATSDKIHDALKKEIRNTGNGKDIAVYHEKTYEDVVLRAKAVAEKGDIVVLSPASTSFDMFKNFEQRGKLFKKLVNEL